MLPRLLSWFNQVKHLECHRICPPPEVQCLHMYSVTWDALVFCTNHYFTVFITLQLVTPHCGCSSVVNVYRYLTTTQCKLPECMSSICASRWKEKHHRRKLQWLKPPWVQVESLCQSLREKHHHRKLLPVATTASTSCKGQDARCKGQDQHQHKSERDAETTCSSNHRHHRPALGSVPALVECTMQQSLQLA